MKLEYESYVPVSELRKFFLAEGSGIYTIYAHGAIVWRIERPDNLKESGLAGATGSDDTHHLAFLYMQINAFKHLQ